jgi:N-acetylglucosaminyl-diphospho-decaprenol L-rhamnosyltransferase
VIDVVVVTADAQPMALACLEHLSSPLLALVVLVDNGSRDGTAEAVRRRWPEVEVVRLKEPSGLAYACNRGAERGAAELVLFLNDDVLASEQSIATLARALEGRADAAGSVGRLVDIDGGATQIEYQPRPFPTLASFVATFIGLERFWRTNPWTGRHRSHPLDTHTIVEVDYAPGACVLVRRRALEAIGGWDDGFQFWYEDVDLAKRLRALGPLLYVPTAPFAHVGGYSARRLSRPQLVSRHYRGALRYAHKHFGAPGRVGTGLLFALAAASKMVVSGDRDARDAYGRVLGDALRLATGRRNTNVIQ